MHMDVRDRVAANHAIWQRWAALHVPSGFYDAEGFIADPASRPFDSIVSGLLGDITGMRALHLQCHFGLDTLRLALLGATATGLDFSDVAIAAARDLSVRSGIPATFIEGDVLAPPTEVSEGGFDVIFTSYGVISWLPDLEAWARTIASRLAPGGVFKIAEMHPTLWIFDDESDDPEPMVRYSYFMREALEWEERGSYAAPGDEYIGTSHSWQHTFEEIIGVLVRAGLRIEELREFPLLAWKYMTAMVEKEPGLFGMPDTQPEVPLTFTLTARKPE
jgi:SAM-dependent methyltransferase